MCNTAVEHNRDKKRYPETLTQEVAVFSLSEKKWIPYFGRIDCYEEKAHKRVDTIHADCAHAVDSTQQRWPFHNAQSDKLFF